jgi:hypothetical protein
MLDNGFGMELFVLGLYSYGIESKIRKGVEWI